jgi:hypothetical protein
MLRELYRTTFALNPWMLPSGIDPVYGLELLSKLFGILRLERYVDLQTERQKLALKSQTLKPDAPIRYVALIQQATRQRRRFRQCEAYEEC